MKRMMIVCGLVSLLVAGSTAYPTGAPSSTCDLPFAEPICHKIQFRSIEYSNTDQYTLHTQPVEGSSDLVQVTLSGAPFNGFVVRATTPGEANLGEFLVDQNHAPFNTLNCSNQENVAVTHVSAALKSSITLMWQDKNKGNYVLLATVVPDLSSYVINIFENK